MRSRQWSDRSEVLELARDSGDLPELLGVEDGLLERWRVTGSGLSRLTVKQLEYLAERAFRHRALAEAGLPTCEWAEAFVFPEGGDLEQMEAAREQVRSHQESCSACQHRVRFLENQFGPALKPPVGFAGSVLRTIAGVVLRFPKPVRPAAAGAALVGGMVLVKAVVALPIAVLMGAPLEGSPFEAVTAIVAGMAAGASGGVVYSAIRPGAKRLGRVGDYLTGIVTIAGYFTGLVVLGPYVFDGPVIQVEDQADIAVLAILVVAFGIVFGHSLFKKADGPAVTER